MRDLISGVVGGEIKVVGDVEIAFEDAFGVGPGVLVIAGTGSIAYGRNAREESARAGGWGHAISDEGSGYWVGVQATRAALRARDRGEDSGLLPELMGALGARDVDEFIVHVNARVNARMNASVNTNPALDFAAFFPVVLSVAGQGDSIANRVLEQAGLELADLAEIVIRRLFAKSEEVAVATHGGVLASSVQVKKSFVQQLQAQCPHVVFLSRTVDPARGALHLARTTFGIAHANQKE